MIRKFYRQLLLVAGLIALVVISYYLNMSVDIKSIATYLKSKSGLIA
jgi:hypothetical protein